VWRDLKRLGGLYLQQCVCILPQLDELKTELAQVLSRVESLGGEYTQFDIPKLTSRDEARIIGAFRVLRSNEYAEIIEECETKFVKEIEFEHFRKNYTFEEAEEIAQDLDKIRRWFSRVQQRDWFGADRANEVEAWLERCQALLVDFEEAVYQRQPSDTSVDESPAAEEVIRGLAPRSIIRLSAPRARPGRRTPEPEPDAAVSPDPADQAAET
jgi:hypothetical protein